MKRLFIILSFIVCAFICTPTTQVLSETVIPVENISKIYQDNETGKFYMTFYVNRELKVASISKTELKKYYQYKQLGVKFYIVLQQLKTKQRIIVRC